MSIGEENGQNIWVFYIASSLLDVGIECWLTFDSVIEIKEKRETWCNVFAHAYIK